MTKTRKILNRLLIVGFIIYLIFLIWNVLFKYVSPFELFGDRTLSRTVNFIPYVDIFNKDYSVLGSIILFIPLGIFLCIYSKDAKIWPKVLAMALLSLALESLQFICCLGIADITNILNNTIGGLVGIGIYVVLIKLFKDEDRIKAFMAIFTTVFIVLISLVLIGISIIN